MRWIPLEPSGAGNLRPLCRLPASAAVRLGAAAEAARGLGAVAAERVQALQAAAGGVVVSADAGVHQPASGQHLFAGAAAAATIRSCMHSGLPDDIRGLAPSAGAAAAGGDLRLQSAAQSQGAGADLGRAHPAARPDALLHIYGVHRHQAGRRSVAGLGRQRAAADRARRGARLDPHPSDRVARRADGGGAALPRDALSRPQGRGVLLCARRGAGDGRALRGGAEWLRCPSA